MSKNCRNFRGLLLADTLGELAPAERDALAHHLEKCPDCRELRRVLLEDDRRLSAFVDSTEPVLSRMQEGIMAKIANPEPKARARVEPRQSFWGSSWLRLATAAALAVCIVLGVNILNRDNGGGMVWAQVLAQIEEAEDYICRRIEKRSDEPAQEIVEYRSAKYGLRQDIYQKDELQATQYIIPGERMMYALVHRDRTYMRQSLSEEQVDALRQQSNAREIVKSFKEYDFRSLGRRRIDGKLAEGIEVTDPEEWRAVFESGTWRLWVDIETQWPVLIELEGVARGGKLRKTYTLKDFQWNAELPAREFAVEIPDSYRLIAELGQVEATEEQTIAGLRAYSDMLGGQYPGSLSLATAIAEAEKELDERHDSYDAQAGKDLESLFAIRNACNFYRDLLTADKDPAYHGDKVSPRHFDRVLLRWRLDDGRYRVIFGDLRAETVSAERLAELEESR